MNLPNMLRAVTGALILATAAGCATGPRSETMGHSVDDAVITTGVKAAILNEPTLKVSEITVETQAGVVQLSGFVASQDYIATAANVARSVRGVKDVRNDIRLK